ncbi:hypothetical protein HYDPIDRAFT_148064 [Hydnomerulius pinastri MD-312]|nr:hypothetical protein HYDPIDRAFT_148064 [Hydnomerulius pinastri MD-312]
MSDRNTYREEGRPTLPPVRDLFRDELSRSPRPPVNSSPPWIVPGAHADQDHYRSSSRAGPRPDGQLYGPGVQRSSSSASHYLTPSQPRHDGRPALHSFTQHPHENPSSQYHSQSHHQYHARSSSEAIHRRPSHDQTTPPGSHAYFNQSPQPYTGSYPTAGSSSSSYYGVPGPYPDSRTQQQRRDSTVSSSASEVVHHPSAPLPSTLKYECDYCGKGFTRPSSLKIHLNSHTGEKPFVCTFDGCGRSFSVLSNMRRHARVHSESTGRPHEGSSDELSEER